MGYSAREGRDKPGVTAGAASPRLLPVFWRPIQVNRLHLQAMPTQLGQICGLETRQPDSLSLFRGCQCWGLRGSAVPGSDDYTA